MYNFINLCLINITIIGIAMFVLSYKPAQKNNKKVRYINKHISYYKSVLS